LHIGKGKKTLANPTKGCLGIFFFFLNPNYYHSKMSIFVWAFFVPLNDFKVKYTFPCHNNTKPLSNNIKIIVQTIKVKSGFPKFEKKRKKMEQIF
jgi:hypothetical protein